jgi:hypothetical protein
MRTSNMSIYARNMTENVTPRMVENREMVSTPALLDNVDDVREPLPV